jgi:hypothetical protein
MCFQHYHVSTNLSKKTQCVPRISTITGWHTTQPLHLRLFQVGQTCPLVIGQNAMEIPSSLQYNVFPTIKPPRERDQVIMEIILSQNLDFTDITRINRCRVYFQALFLEDITMADGKYLKHFVFDPGGVTTRSGYIRSQENNHHVKTGTDG